MRSTVLFKGSCFCVVDLKDALPRNEFFPNQSIYWAETKSFIKGMLHYDRVKGRKIDKAIIHHTAGSTRHKGFRGPMETAGYIVQNPRVEDGKIVAGTGRGWPGMAYHLYVPFAPETHKEEKLPTLYSCWPADWHIWHTKGENDHGYGVVCQGKFVGANGTPGDKGQPSKLQYDCLLAAWDEWIKPSLGLTDVDLWCHADFTKPACPGGTLKHWVRQTRTDNRPVAD